MSAFAGVNDSTCWLRAGVLAPSIFAFSCPFCSRNNHRHAGWGTSQDGWARLPCPLGAQEQSRPFRASHWSSCAVVVTLDRPHPVQQEQRLRLPTVLLGCLQEVALLRADLQHTPQPQCAGNVKVVYYVLASQTPALRRVALHRVGLRAGQGCRGPLTVKNSSALSSSRSRRILRKVGRTLLHGPHHSEYISTTANAKQVPGARRACRS